MPVPVSAQLGLEDETRAYSAPATNDMDILPPNSPDSSNAAGNDDDSLSNLSEAREITQNDMSVEGSPRNDLLPKTVIEPLELTSGGSDKNSNSAGSVPMAPRPGARSAGSRPDSGRPGSERHPVLPPISATSPQLVDPLPEF